MSTTDSYHDSASSDPERLHWNPAMEYLFGVLLVIITLMAVILLKFSCSKLQPAPNPPPSYHSERPEQQLEIKLENYDAPAASDEVFVIMAGEQTPSCLAKPVASPTTRPCEQGESDFQSFETKEIAVSFNFIIEISCKWLMK
ncbi:protein GLUTAMINE DUMPER 6-like [Durio zibethinus]|uniref:Protein GLUTAMINE DUMPER 6-like n=1 Tax=Durio zibethinus TaxID=66656 RepID=A0A6P5ZSW9_DURZI|nr:protein GLUTAMINE DUMPER 6-like [Durio zibethinus]